MKRRKHRQQLDPFHLLRIVSYLKKNGGGGKSHKISWYDKEQLPYLISTQHILFNDVHIQQVSGPHMTSKFNIQKISQSTSVNLTFFKRNPDYTVINIG